MWFIDLKTGTGQVGKGEAPNSADATLTMHSKDFADMFAGMWPINHKLNGNTK